MTLSSTGSVRPSASDRLNAPTISMALRRFAVRFGWWTLAVSASGFVLFAFFPGWIFGVDVEVYYRGAAAAFSGDLYTGTYGPYTLPFTYPPFAALVFQPLVLLPLASVMVLWTAATVACLWQVLRWLLPSHWSAIERSRGAVLLTAVLMWADPVRSTMTFAQVNVFLVTLVMADLVGRSRNRWLRWIPTGVLVGIASAIKLTPALFIIYLLLCKRWKDAAWAAGSAIGATLLAFLVLPRETMTYFLGGIGNNPARVGPIEYVSNQSIYGALSRWLDGSSLVTPLWLGLAAIVGALGIGVAVAVAKRGDQAIAALLVGVTACLVSPISWSHHWVWAVLLGVALACSPLAVPRQVAVGVGLVALFVWGPIWRLRSGAGVEWWYSPWEDLVASCYAVAAVAAMMWLAEWLIRTGATELHVQAAARELPKRALR